MSNLFVIIPAKNEASQIGEVILRIREQGFKNIIVVDDGSNDKTADIAKNTGAKVLKHIVNRGAGAATYTGIKAALSLNAEIIVTIDADGQHNPVDLQNLIKPILEKKVDVVIGSRLKQKKNMPAIRRFFNFGGNLITWILFGLWVTDSQSGFKAFSRKAAESIEIKTNGYEFCSEVIREIKMKKLKFIEIPIKTHYSKYSLQKGQSFANGIRTFGKLILRSLMQ